MTFHELPTVFEDVGLALLTILIPLAIAILTDLFQKKGSKPADFVELDLLIILKRIFNVTWILVLGILIFLPFVFWGTSVYWNIFATLLSGASIVCFSKVILDIYLWISGESMKYRFSYLEEVKKNSDIKIAWRSVWTIENIDYGYEIRFLKIFLSRLEKMAFGDSDDVATAAIILKDFADRINSRLGFSLAAGKEFLPKLLDLNYSIWRRWAALLKEDSMIDQWSYFDYLQREVSAALSETVKRGLKTGETYGVFNSYEKHVATHWKAAEDQGRNYVRRLLAGFYKTFFSILTDIVGEQDNVVYLFPKQWQITKENLSTDRNPICELSLENLYGWAPWRIVEANDKSMDESLDFVMNIFFPNVHQIIWADILIFTITPFSDNRVSSAIRYHKSFGLIAGGHLHPAVTSPLTDDDPFREMTDNAFDLALILFPEIFTLDNIKSFQQMASQLRFEDNTEQKWRLGRLQYIFENLRERLEKPLAKDNVTT